MDTVVVREMKLTDAAQVAELSGELGYPVQASDMEARIRAIAGAQDHALYVACMGERVAGWIDIAIVHHLASEPFGEIAGLVVSEELRSSGIGRRLIDRAEEWIASHGVCRVVVRSRVMRERAHGFYLQQGFEEWKRQIVFRKQL